MGGQLLGRKRVTSLYFGGGTPALAAGRLKEVMEAIEAHFIITEGVGVELHPEKCGASAFPAHFCGMRG